jgi:hypothetical protein
MDLLGARASNAGDEFHELWATRAAIRLLDRRDDLCGLTVEGVAAIDGSVTDPRVWDGVDCTLYFGGLSADSARHIRIEQLKYSSGAPQQAWTVGRLVSGTDRASTVLNKLARSWAHLKGKQKGKSTLEAALVTNQPISESLRDALARLQANPPKMPKVRPDEKDDDVLRIAWAIGMAAPKAAKFVEALELDGGAGSRFSVEEKALAEIARWTDQDVVSRLSDIRKLVRDRMMPGPAGEVITAESILLRMSAVEYGVLFPCPPVLAETPDPISRAEVETAVHDLVRNSTTRLCLHGEAGIGKTTALEQIRRSLPSGSEMVVYDCYGAGRYLDSDAVRHRPHDAFLQLTNEIAVQLKLPLLVTRPAMIDPARVFMSRLRHAAGVLAAEAPAALLVIGVDAADNSIAAARIDQTRSFVRDFAGLGELPSNVRLIVTCRTGRIDDLSLPKNWRQVRLEHFDTDQTAEFVARRFSVTAEWVQDFHVLARGVPRVQAYALRADEASDAMARLLPGGKSLGDVFQSLFHDALKKSGVSADIGRVCAGLIALPRPVPIADLAVVVDLTPPELIDICGDLAPGLRLTKDTIGFADEDFEDFVRAEAHAEASGIQSRVADRLLANASTDRYAALHVAAALREAGRKAELLDLVEAEPAPLAVTDPVLRREAELNRLRSAIQVCRASGDRTRALRFILMGADGVRSEKALRAILKDNSDLAVRFADGTVGRLLLSDVSTVADQGSILYQRLAANAERSDRVSMREGGRLIEAWWQMQRAPDARPHSLTDNDIIAHIDAMSRARGADVAIKAMRSWKPKALRITVAAHLPWMLAVQNRQRELDALIAEPSVHPARKAMLRAPLLLQGRSIDIVGAADLRALLRRTDLGSFFKNTTTGSTRDGGILDVLLTGCELMARDADHRGVVSEILKAILEPAYRRIDIRFSWEAEKLDILFRAWTLSERLAGRAPVLKDLFVPREVPAEPLGEDVKRSQASHDLDLSNMLDAVGPLYLVRGDAVVSALGLDVLQERLDKALDALSQAEWRLGREHGAPLLRALAARALLSLGALHYPIAVVAEAAVRVHGPLARVRMLPNRQFIQRLSLWPELHARLVDEISAAARAWREARIGAEDRSSALMAFARMLLPISPEDANVVFNEAVEAVAELDGEMIQQLELIERLVTKAGPSTPSGVRMAGELAEIVSDAAIRLEGHSGFPWASASSALSTLDPVEGLAASARWDDGGLDEARDGLASAIKAGLRSRELSAAQAAALSLFLDEEDPEITDHIGRHGVEAREEIAWDRLLRWNGRGGSETSTTDGPWTEAVVRRRRFVDDLKTPQLSAPADPPGQSSLTAIAQNPWSTSDLVEPTALGEEVLKRLDAAHAAQTYVGAGEILATAAAAAAPKDRIAFLNALGVLRGRRIAYEIGGALLRTLQGWRHLPAVSRWCKAVLPEIIVSRLPDFTRSLAYQDGAFDALLELCELDDDAAVDLLLRGMENHVGVLDAEIIFGLTERMVARLAPGAAADLSAWYISLLGARIPASNREPVDRRDLPSSVDEAVARYLFAYMGDRDVRLRWRAAHGVRRLARLGDRATLAAFNDCVFRQAESVFRVGDAPFYWLSARQWWALSWARVATDRPPEARLAAPLLFELATSATLPHLLIQLWAADACRSLSAAGEVTWSSDEASALAAVGRTSLAREAATKRQGLGRYERTEARGSRRFDFDVMDTLPYWYDPVLRCFATLQPAAFLDEAERWILDVWGYPADPREQDQSDAARRGRSDWTLSSNSHGSQPTIVDFRTYLEWNGLWAAAGRLLRTEPLRDLGGDYEDTWENLLVRARSEMLTDPPGWLSDFRAPTPLLSRHWIRDDTPLEAWAAGVVEAHHRAELLPEDRPDYLVVHGHGRLTMEDRAEDLTITSALVGRDAAASLIRALQTMDNSWDYKIPDEEEESWTIDRPPFRLIGWLGRNGRDRGADDKDPFRGQSGNIRLVPGRRVVESLRLSRHKSGLAAWSAEGAETPMFIHEAWGEPDKDNEWIGEGVRTDGERLLVHRGQLRAFLAEQDLDLVVEVEIRRNDRESGRYTGKKAKREVEGRYDRLYRLDCDGGLHVAEGDIGTWSGAVP